MRRAGSGGGAEALEWRKSSGRDRLQQAPGLQTCSQIDQLIGEPPVCHPRAIALPLFAPTLPLA